MSIETIRFVFSERPALPLSTEEGAPTIPGGSPARLTDEKRDRLAHREIVSRRQRP